MIDMAAKMIENAIDILSVHVRYSYGSVELNRNPMKHDIMISK